MNTDLHLKLNIKTEYWYSVLFTIFTWFGTKQPDFYYNYSNFSKFVSGAKILNNKTCDIYYAPIPNRSDLSMAKTTFEYCVQKCQQSELCEFATWKRKLDSSNIGQCQLSNWYCDMKDIHNGPLLYKLWQKSKFHKTFHISILYLYSIISKTSRAYTRW